METKHDWFLEQAKIESYPVKQNGGQTVGKFTVGIRITCPETNFQIVVDWFPSMIKNRDLAVKLYKEYLNEIGFNA